MTPVDRSPTRVASAVAVAAALAAVGASGPYSWIALGTGGAGLALVAGGVLAGRHGLVTTGSAGLFVAVLAAGLRGAPAAVVLGGTVAAVLAWDSGGTAIDLGAQLGRAAPTARLELRHTGATALVGLSAAALGAGAYGLGVGGRPLAGPTFLIVAACCIAVALATGRR